MLFSSPPHAANAHARLGKRGGVILGQLRRLKQPNFVERTPGGLHRGFALEGLRECH